MREDILNKIYSIREKAFSFINEAESLLNRVILLSIIIVVLVWINLGRIIELAVSESRIKSNLVTKLEEVSGKKAEVLGEVTFKNDPEPVVSVNNVKIHNNSDLTNEDYFHADVIKSRPRILRAILGKADLDDIYFEGVKINLGSSKQEKDGFDSSLGKSFSKGGKFYGKKLKFKDLEVNLYKKNPLAEGSAITRKVFFPTLEIIPNPKNTKAKYQILGSVSSKKFNELYYFDIKLAEDFGSKSPYEAKLYSNNSELNFSGTIDTDNKLDFQGKIEGKSTGLTKKLLSILGMSEEFLESLRENDESVVSGEYSYDGMNLSINNFKSEGKVLTFALNSKTDLADKISTVADINASQIDYSQMFKSYMEIVSEKRAKKIERDFKKKLEEYFLFAIGDDINFLVNINAPSIKFFHEKQGSFNATLLMKDSNFKIKKLTADLPGETNLNLAGDLEINKKDKQLKGSARMVLNGKSMDQLQYALEADSLERKEKRFGTFFVDTKAFFYGQNIHLREMVAKINEDKMAGQIIADYSNEFKASAAFNFTSLNLDKYLAYDEKPDLGGAGEQNPLARKFDFLRVVDSVFDKLDISLIADDMVKAGYNYTDVSIYAQITPGNTEVKDIFFISDIMGEVQGKANLDLSEFRPRLDIDLKIDSYDADLLIYGELVKQDDEYNFDGKWSTEKLGGFLGKMKIKIGELKIYHFLLKNFVITSHAEESKFVIDQARADLFGNKIDFKGYLTTEYPSFSLSFIASELQSDKFMASTLNLNQLYSIFNMSGVLASSGYSIEQMIQNLKGNISVATKGFSVSGFDIATIAKALPLAKRREYVKLISDELLNKGKTEFNFFIGAFNIQSGHVTFTDLPISGMNVQSAKVSGNIDLPNWSLAVNSSMSVVTRDKGSFELSSKTTGSISNIRTTWDTSGMMQYWENKFFNGR